MKRLLILFFLASCVSPTPNVKSNNMISDFYGDLSYNEFKNLLIKYADSSNYPDIN